MSDKYWFRGKIDGGAHCGEWVMGFLHFYRADNPIAIIAHHETGEMFRVLQETIGQCTGIADNSGKLIFEGDIIKGCGCKTSTYCSAIKWVKDRCGFFIFEPNESEECELMGIERLDPKHTEVISDIYSLCTYDCGECAPSKLTRLIAD